MATPIASRAETVARPAIRGLWWKAATGVWMCLAILAAVLYVGPAVQDLPWPLTENTRATDLTGKLVAKDVVGRDGAILVSAGTTLTEEGLFNRLKEEGVKEVIVRLPSFSMEGHGAKAVFFHVPCAWLTFLTFLAAAWYAGRFLRKLGQSGWQAVREDDHKCAAAMELGLLFAVLATVTGMIFSNNEWGRYWSWDPRQTSILVVLLIFAAYLVLRGAVEDPEKRARLASVYALVSVVPGIFLIWVLPRIVPTLHEGPNTAVIGGGLGGNYRLVLYGLCLPAFLALFTWLFQLRLRVMKREMH